MELSIRYDELQGAAIPASGMDTHSGGARIGLALQVPALLLGQWRSCGGAEDQTGRVQQGSSALPHWPYQKPSSLIKRCVIKPSTRVTYSVR